MNRKKSNKGLLQKYVDHKLNSIRCDCDDLSDYLENYTDYQHIVYKEDLEKWGFNPNEFIHGFKPSEAQIEKAIKKSPLLNVLAERYKIAVLKGITHDIYYNSIDEDKNLLAETLEEDKKATEKQQANEKLRSLRSRLKSYRFTREEKKLIDEKLR